MSLSLLLSPNSVVVGSIFGPHLLERRLVAVERDELREHPDEQVQDEQAQHDDDGPRRPPEDISSV